MMGRDHLSPEFSDASDLMCGLIQELSSLKSVNLFLSLRRHCFISIFLLHPDN